MFETFCCCLFCSKIVQKSALRPNHDLFVSAYVCFCSIDTIIGLTMRFVPVVIPVSLLSVYRPSITAVSRSPLQIDIVNCVRRALEGRHQAVELSSALCDSPRLQRLLLDSVLAALPGPDSPSPSAAAAAAAAAAAVSPADEECRERLRLLLLRTGQHAPGLIPALAQHAVGAALYTPDQLRELVELHTDTEEDELPSDPPPADTGIHDPIVEVRTNY